MNFRFVTQGAPILRHSCVIIAWKGQRESSRDIFATISLHQSRSLLWTPYRWEYIVLYIDLGRFHVKNSSVIS